ncbi:WXG100 family type VII secretion target [Streptomyces sp. NBC_01218]|uniref:WXG100 family type VII secretion target n=1 Tax=unclassified Streptomyces TaxID=2593676 RepID=UPI0023BA2CBA|nr:MULTISPECIES: WXG100 family type VII secretion target [unclassified Streptomyces]WEH43414.1 WXG100 family type VII secretion target [Streptomyces sp. AM 2-1-1]WSQ55050.1 WXG100 family type VII secretion target [Streptomyces sp. NBC_01218]
MPDYSDGFIKVDYSHADNAADDMVLQTAAIKRTLSELEMELQTLKQSWIGDDADVYTGKQAAWDEAVTRMETLLKSHASLLTDVSQNYRWTENSLSQQWSEIRIGVR